MLSDFVSPWQIAEHEAVVPWKTNFGVGITILIPVACTICADKIHTSKSDTRMENLLFFIKLTPFVFTRSDCSVL